MLADCYIADVARERPPRLAGGSSASAGIMFLFFVAWEGGMEVGVIQDLQPRQAERTKTSRRIHRAVPGLPSVSQHRHCAVQFWPKQDGKS